MSESGTAGRKFEELVGILGTLRGPDGCPWDKAQTSRDIRDYFLEEVFEAVEALEAGDAAGLAEELGDVLMEVVFLARIQEEAGAFSIGDALDRINAKMISRHPHVFASARKDTASGVAHSWQEGKKEEKGAPSVLESPGPAIPALLAAFEIGRRVAAYGFDWPDASGVLEKVKEETAELEEALAKGQPEAVEEELGDLLFSLANLSRKLGVNPEVALRKADGKFVRRFQALEAEVRSSGRDLRTLSLAEMDAVWDRQKVSRHGM